jgi:hypothetical protein
MPLKKVVSAVKKVKSIKTPKTIKKKTAIKKPVVKSSPVKKVVAKRASTRKRTKTPAHLMQKTLSMWDEFGSDESDDKEDYNPSESDDD